MFDSRAAYQYLIRPRDPRAGSPANRMTNDELEQRLTELEIKASFAEDLVDALNRQVARQQQQIDLLLREVGELRRQGSAADAASVRGPRDELPPHY